MRTRLPETLARPPASPTHDIIITVLYTRRSRRYTTHFYFFPMEDYIENSDNGRDSWLTNAANKLPQYATKYGIPATEIDDMTKSAAFYHYWLVAQAESTAYGKKLTAYKKELVAGIKAGVTASVMPAAPNLGAVPPVVAPGIFVRARKIAQRIKAHNNYTEADGKDLRLIGIKTTIDANAAKPVLSVQLVQGGKPELHWLKAKFTGLHIFADYDNWGNFTLIAQGSKNNWTDKKALPANGVSAVWAYKAIYVQGDDEVGQMSEMIRVTVTGHT
jgi:hypothetical protein